MLYQGWLVDAPPAMCRFVVKELIKRGFNVAAFARPKSGIGGKSTQQNVEKVGMPWQIVLWQPDIMQTLWQLLAAPNRVVSRSNNGQACCFCNSRFQVMEQAPQACDLTRPCSNITLHSSNAPCCPHMSPAWVKKQSIAQEASAPTLSSMGASMQQPQQGTALKPHPALPPAAAVYPCAGL